MNYPLIGLLGGTFDPIHRGHLHIGLELLKIITFENIQFIPCPFPPHRAAPHAHITDRLQMIRLALHAQEKIFVNDIETQLPKPCYTLETLIQLKALNPKHALGLIIGADVFAHFDQWHRWEEILNYCHLIVVNRPEAYVTLNDRLSRFVVEYGAHAWQALSTQCSGAILQVDVPPCNISASRVRAALQSANREEAHALLDPQVFAFIEKNRLYL
jgi:nicotinate-nucleotide adenylyltransferase